ncbi:MAG: hypothetical protein LBC72_05385 [Spirochaetaceae bacterium]|jgi:negative regulator of replication initiation|nr:hypothetical protein [Spirochaetaceae bacterium]
MALSRQSQEITPESNTDVLRHLLDVEAAAAAVVREAAAAAEKMTAETERREKARFEAEYGRLRAELEAEYAAKQAEAEKNAVKELDDYSATLTTLACDQGLFNREAARFLHTGGC